ncbi:MAG: hypothetical protein HXO84_01515 [Selenomonas sp.]|nr:hypothetical protein [Selenomonas sp.]
MKFYGKIAGLALGISFLSMTAVQASVPQDALAAGGIAYGASESYVRSIYGAPREVETKYDSMYAGSHVTEWEYGSDFDITFVDGVVRQIEVGARNIMVGSDLSALIAAYGQPDVIHGDDYIYRVDGDNSVGLTFEIEHGRVAEFCVGTIR